MSTNLSNYAFNTKNPFIEQSISEVNKHIVKKYKTASNTGEKAILKAIDTDTGEILGHTQFIRQIEVDEEQFAKMYLSNFNAFFDLKPSSIKVFGYILNCLKPNKDEFLFIMKDCLEYTKYSSKVSVFKGLAQLVENEIIARGRTDFLYFINPMVVFNGSRVTFAKTYVKQKKVEQVKGNKQLDLVEEIKGLE
ncbi:replication/maintenance protein RepL [Tenacibaculum finnmarkense]|uniref:replication/maintenance protein RepL n=1 Tax=Tenacibaculum finnmarkense TaxID=2781243 RepID=UPI001EFBD14F|nr:replication/maintenance protein RepL [Tenacibaculum finnmarkense]MCG8758099.1 RepA protein [Tenacibaculum finnmarkense]MCG8768607.1 RepA protein [Tenacibaculum finnmarkense]MCG8768612.1 RepA protein [Tenacibaculum finnmarkense]MCG8849667.1 RepA protein [Tenacibaculum finnmarkense]